MRLAIFRALVALAVALSLPLSAAAAAAPTADSSLLEQAEAAKKRGEHHQAGDKYRDYYRSLGPEDRANETGQYIVAFATTAYRAAGDRVALEALQQLLQTFVSDVSAANSGEAPGWLAEQQAALREVDDLLAEPATGPAPGEPTVAAPPEREVEDPPVVVPPNDKDKVVPPGPVVRAAPADESPGVDKVGLGLVIGGAVVVVGGVAMLAIGSQLGPIARDAEAEEAGNGNGSTVPSFWVPQQERRGKILMGVGGGVAALGLGAAIWGAVRIRNHRTQGRAASLSVGPTTNRPGLLIQGRF